MVRFDAAKSMYGTEHLAAIRTRECAAMPGHREQVIYTPEFVCDSWRVVWPEGIALDPCSSDEPARTSNFDGLPLALSKEDLEKVATSALMPILEDHWVGRPAHELIAFMREYAKELPATERGQLRKAVKKVKSALKGEPDLGSPGPNALVRAQETYSLERGDDGLTKPWCPRTFVNPPYATLKDWMQKAEAESEAEGAEVGMLVPARTHRKWLRLDRWSAVCFMDPFPFYGSKSAFPQPMLSLYFGQRVESFKEAFAPHGRVVTVSVL